MGASIALRRREILIDVSGLSLQPFVRRHFHSLTIQLSPQERCAELIAVP